MYITASGSSSASSYSNRDMVTCTPLHQAPAELVPIATGTWLHPVIAESGKLELIFF